MTVVLDRGAWWIETVVGNSAATVNGGTMVSDMTLEKPGTFIGGCANYTNLVGGSELVGGVQLRKAGAAVISVGDHIAAVQVRAGNMSGVTITAGFIATVIMRKTGLR